MQWNFSMKQETVFRGLRWFRSLLFLAAVEGWFCLAMPLTLVAADSTPCSTSAENRQLDYWLGDWSVSYPGTPGGSTSKVDLSLDKCLVVERWDAGKYG
jgi:hypothetical protein